MLMNQVKMKKQEPWTFIFKSRGNENVISFESGHTNVIYSYQALKRICCASAHECEFIPVPKHVLDNALCTYEQQITARAA